MAGRVHALLRKWHSQRDVAPVRTRQSVVRDNHRGIFETAAGLCHIGERSGRKAVRAAHLPQQRICLRVLASPAVLDSLRHVLRRRHEASNPVQKCSSGGY